MKRKIFCLLLSLIVIFHSLPAYAQQLPSIVSAPGDTTDPVISPLQKNQKAPFSGVLLNPPAVAQIKVELDTAEQKCKIETNRSVSVCQAQCDKKTNDLIAENERLQAIASAREKSQQSQILELQNVIKKSTSGPSPGLWVGLGTAGGVLLTLGTVWVVAQVTR